MNLTDKLIEELIKPDNYNRLDNEEENFEEKATNWRDFSNERFLTNIMRYSVLSCFEIEKFLDAMCEDGFVIPEGIRKRVVIEAMIYGEKHCYKVDDEEKEDINSIQKIPLFVYNF